VGRAANARRVAAAAAYGGGGLGLAGVAAYGLLRGQAKLARRAIPRAEVPPPVCDGLYGADQPGEPLTAAMLGDSSAAGYGVALARDTPGALLAAGLAELAGRPVRLVCRAVVGARSVGLDAQVDAMLTEAPDVTVIMIGGNDVTHRVRPQDAVRQLDQVVRRLRAIGSEVVVGTCPDLGTIKPIQPPLRWVARRASRILAAAQTIAVVEAGGRSVSLGDLLGPEFAASPGEMFSADRFHPSAEGYSAAAAALLPSVAAALGVWDPVEDAPSQARGEGVLPLPQAAVEAADAAGTEVSATALAGRDRGTLGRWAQLRHRIQLFTAAPADPQEEQRARIPAPRQDG
jgi:lysophospholipase L1-like esterase